MKEQSESEDVGFKPGDLSPGNMLFLKIIFAVGIALPIFLCGYGLISFFFFGVQ